MNHELKKKQSQLFTGIFLNLRFRPKEDTTKSLQAELSGYLKKLKNHSSVWPFLKPVDIDEVPDYLDVIKDPIGTLGAW